jgi:hypothetical protein
MAAALIGQPALEKHLTHQLEDRNDLAEAKREAIAFSHAAAS